MNFLTISRWWSIVRVDIDPRLRPVCSNERVFTNVMDLVGGYDAWEKTWGAKESKVKRECIVGGR